MATKTENNIPFPSNPNLQTSNCVPHSTSSTHSQAIYNSVLSVFSNQGLQKLSETHLLRDALSNKHILDCQQDTFASQSPLLTPPTPDTSAKTAPSLDTLSCSLCDVIFSSRQEMLEHYREDWHRYNLRMQLAGKKPLGEQDFSLLLSQDISSISGSDSSDSDTNAHFKSPPKLMLYSHSDGTVFSVYRELVHHPGHTPSTVDQLIKQISLVPDKSRIAVLMHSAGHFAGAIFHSETVICHKTFHRYVVRAKGGTLQSKHDNINVARSMGAQMRRANEVALIKDIQELLRSWSDKLAKCDLIFIRIPVYSKQTFYAEGESFGFLKDEPRIRPIPVNTRRPTFTEVKRIHTLLTSLLVHGTLSQFSTQEDDLAQPLTISPTVPVVADSLQAIDSEGVDKETEQEERLVKKAKHPRRAKKNNKLTTEITDPKELFFHQLIESCGRCETPRVLSLLAEIGQPLQFPVGVEHTEGDEVVSLESDEDWVLLEDPIDSVIEDNDVIEDDVHDSSLLESESAGNETSDPLQSTETGGNTWGNLSEAEKRSVLQMKDADGYTPLHLAAHKGFSPLIFHFLRYGADPAVKDRHGKVPYEISRDKSGRDAFRRFMFSHPTAYDYSTAKISSPLSPEMEEEQRKRKVEKKKHKSVAKKQKKNQSRGKQEGGCKALTGRERRALAAEKRFMAPEGTAGPPKQCAQCLKGMLGDNFFEKSSYFYCSMHCLKKHRQQIAL